jgi:hypothetical protein
LNLSRENIVTIEKMLACAEDKCYYCGANDHYINICPQKNKRRITQKHKKFNININIKPKDIPKSKILKYYGATKLLQNSNLEPVKTEKTIKEKSQRFRCRYCNKFFNDSHKRNNHENVICILSDKVRHARVIEADADAILEANKKYLKDNKGNKGNK